MTEHTITDTNWSEAFPLQGVTCFLARDGENWLIATAEPPRFCFSETSQLAALEKAVRAIEFWRYSKAAESNASAIAGGTCGHGTPLAWHCEKCADGETLGETK